MEIFKNVKIAEEMELPKQFAVRSRQRFLTSELRNVKTDIVAFIDYLERLDYGVEYELFYTDTVNLIKKQLDINKELDIIKRMKRVQDNGISEEMIESARNYPIDKIIEFKRGNALAWCHDDKRPSLRYMNKTNKAWCPVCDKYFDAIAVLMERDCYKFIDAVKALS